MRKIILNKKGDTQWSLSMLVTLVLAGIFLIMFFIGLISGMFVPLKERLSGMWDNAQSLYYSVFSSGGGGGGEISEEQIKTRTIEVIDNYDSVYKIEYEGKVLVEIENKECVNAMTKPLGIIFTNAEWSLKSGAKQIIGVAWDARGGENGKAVARAQSPLEIKGILSNSPIAGIDRWYSSDEIKKINWKKMYIALDVGGYNSLLNILSAPNIDIFVVRIFEEVNEKDSIIVDWSRETSETISSIESIKDKITENGWEDYLKKWGRKTLAQTEGVCLSEKLEFSCDFFGKSGVCYKEDYQGTSRFCIKDGDGVCGSGCLCPENYEKGYKFYMRIGDQDWVFEISEDGGYTKKCISPISPMCDNSEQKVSGGELKKIIVQEKPT